MAIALVQHTETTTTASVASLAKTFGSSTTTGNLLVACITYYLGAGTPTTTSVTDNKGNTWVQAGSAYIASSDNKTATDIWYCKNATGGASHTVTVTPSASSFINFSIQEYSGADTSAPFDQVHINSGTFTGGGTVSTGNVVTGSGGELYIAVAASSLQSTNPSARSWTSLFEDNLSHAPSLMVQAQGHTSTIAAGTYAATWTFSSNETWAASVATFKVASGAASFTVSPSTIPANHSGNLTLTLTGTGTSWAAQTFTITNSVTGTTTVTKTAQNIASGTSATLTVHTGAGTGTYTISDGTLTSPSLTVGTASFTISPTSGPTGGTPTITFTGTNTLWTQETAAGLFTLSGGTGASIGTPTVTTNTAATATLTAGSAAGTLTITDTSTGATATYTVTAGTITVTKPVTNQVFKRTGHTNGIGGTAGIVITGTYTGSPTAIEASFNGGAYATIVASPAGGTFSGTLTGQAAGQGTLTVRFTNATAVNATVSLVGVGDVLLVIGQSNGDGALSNNQAFLSANSLLSASLNKKDLSWGVLTDPTGNSFDSGSAGSVWPLVATAWMAYTRCPLAVINACVGGTSVADWQPGADHQDVATKYGAANHVVQAGGTGGVSIIAWWNGETDSVNGTSQASYHTGLVTLVAALWTDMAAPFMPCNFQHCDPATAPDANQNAVNAAITAARSDIAHVSPQVVSFTDIDTMPGNTLHLKTDAQGATAAARWWDAIYQTLFAPAGGGTSGGGIIGG